MVDRSKSTKAWQIRAVRFGPKIVCLCGSTRFKKEYEQQNKIHTLHGNIVLTVGMFGHSGDVFTDKEKEKLDETHRRKIDLAEEVIIICPGGYIGDSTRSELVYATEAGKRIRFPYGKPS
jgi:hypothetical protein